MNKCTLLGLFMCLFFAQISHSLPTRNYASSWLIIAAPAPVLTCTYSFYTPFMALDFIECVDLIGSYFNYYPAVYLIGSTTVCIELFTTGMHELTSYDYFMAQAIDQLFYLEFAT